MELSEVGAPPWTVVVAHGQTGGRGRRGRPWTSAPGSGLWMSVLVGTPREGFALPLVVGACVADALDALGPGIRSALKWPNDVLVSGRKVAGILCEQRGGQAIVGIGVNLETPEMPDNETGYAAIGIQEVVGATVRASELCGAVLTRLRAALSEPSGYGWARGVFEARDALRGVQIVSETMGEGVGGGVTREGALILERSDGARVSVVSGSVRVRPGGPHFANEEEIGCNS